MKEKYEKPKIEIIPIRKEAKMTIDEQLEKWVAGESVHNIARNECTPDFSCCNSSYLASPEKRKLFYDAHKAGDHKTTESMLVEFLGAMLTAHGHVVVK